DVPDGTDDAPAMAGGQRMRRVLDHTETVLASDVEYFVHRSRMTGEMDRHNRSRAGCDLARDVTRIEVQSVWTDVHQNWSCAGMHNGRSGGGECERAGDNLRIFRKLERVESEMQRRRARVDGDRLDRADRVGKGLLELVCPWTGGQPP